MSIKQDIEKHLTENGGYTKKSLAVFGVSWPPPKGWKDLLIKNNMNKVTMSKELQKRVKDREIKSYKECQAMNVLESNHILQDLIDADLLDGVVDAMLEYKKG